MNWISLSEHKMITEIPWNCWTVGAAIGVLYALYKLLDYVITKCVCFFAVPWRRYADTAWASQTVVGICATVTTMRAG